MADEAKQALIVTVSGNRPIHDVARDLRAAGLDVDQVLEFTGTVTGSAQPQTVNKLRGVPGVADVSADHPVDIGPPGAPVS
jgi:hypothetical protein